MDFQKNILDEVANIDVYDDSKHHNWVRFPPKLIGMGQIIIEITNSPIYDRKSEGSVRFLDPKWIKEHCQKKLIVRLKNNINRALVIPAYVRKINSTNNDLFTKFTLNSCLQVYLQKNNGTKVL